MLRSISIISITNEIYKYRVEDDEFPDKYEEISLKLNNPIRERNLPGFIHRFVIIIKLYSGLNLDVILALSDYLFVVGVWSNFSFNYLKLINEANDALSLYYPELKFSSKYYSKLIENAKIRMVFS